MNNFLLRPGPTSGVRAGFSLRVLVADPHPVNQQLWSHLLRQLGHTSQAALSATEALELAGQFTFDVVLVDLDSPEVDGFTSAKRIRQRSRDLERPWIVGCSLAITDADTDRAMGAGINDLMVRSGRRDELARVLQDAGRALGVGQRRVNAA